MSDEFTRPPQDDAENIAPQKLMENFTQNRVLKYLAIAAIAHLVVIVGTTSPRTLYEMVNPAAKKSRLEKERSEEQAALNARLKKDEAPDKGAAGKSAAGSKDDDGTHDRKDTEVYKDISEKATPDEIPDKPDDVESLFDD